jgi:hypothetical protein
LNRGCATIGGTRHGWRSPGVVTEMIRPLLSVIASPPVFASIGWSSLSQRGVHALGKRRSLTTISALRHAVIRSA